MSPSNTRPIATRQPIQSAPVGGQPIAWLSFACAASALVLVALYCVAALLALGHYPMQEQADWGGALGFALAALAVGLAALNQLRTHRQEVDPEARHARIQAWRDAVRCVSAAFIAVLVVLLLIATFYAIPGLHSQITWVSDRVPIAGIVFLVAGIAGFRAYMAQRSVNSANLPGYHTLAVRARAVGFSVMMAYVLIYGLSIALGILFLIVYLLFHLPIR